jgi:hypothetical protein
LKIRQVEGYRNYDKSEFDSLSEFLDGDDDALEGVWTKQHSLQEFVDPNQFKSYAELETRLVRVLGLTSYVSTPGAEQPVVEAPPVLREVKAATVEEDVDESLSFFEALADDDR